METCPYNPSHRIIRSRMPYHLLKCQKQYPNVELVTCPFDATHKMPKSKFQHHLSTCPDRKVVEKHKYPTLSECVHGDLSPAPFHHPELEFWKENWDEEISASNEHNHHSDSQQEQLHSPGQCSSSDTVTSASYASQMHGAIPSLSKQLVTRIGQKEDDNDSHSNFRSGFGRGYLPKLYRN